MTQTRPKRSSAESQRSVLARCAGPVGAGARETEGDDRRGPARRGPDLPTRKTSIRRSAQNWDELGSRLRGMDSPSALAFLLMIFAGWVNRHQQIVIEFSQAENRLLKQPRRKQSWFFRTLCDATTGGHDRPGGLKFERQHLVPMRGLCSTNEVAMTVVPGLSRPLKTVGKHVGGWNEGDDCLWWTRAVLFDRRLVRAARVAAPECMGLTDAGSMIGRASASASPSRSRFADSSASTPNAPSVRSPSGSTRSRYRARAARNDRTR